MHTLQQHHDEKRFDEIINEIIELKYDKTTDNTYRIQKLQQELGDIEKRLNKDTK